VLRRLPRIVLVLPYCSLNAVCVQSSAGYVEGGPYPGAQPAYGWCRTGTPVAPAYYAHPAYVTPGPHSTGYYAPPPGYPPGPGPVPGRYVINDRVLPQPASGAGGFAPTPFSNVAQRNIQVCILAIRT